MSGSEAITRAEWLARTLAANRTTHVFFIDAMLRRTLNRRLRVCSTTCV